MKRFVSALALLTFVVASAAQAQGAYLFAGGGVSIPTGEYKDTDKAKNGYVFSGGLGVNTSTKGLWLEAEGWYGSNKHTTPVGDKTNLTMGFGAMGYSLAPDSKVSPSILVGAGFLNHKWVPKTGTGSSETMFAYTAAFGLGAKLTKQVTLWGEARYIGTSSTKLIPITAGLSFNLKGN